MNTAEDEVAPAVTAILETADERGTQTDRLTVDARSLQGALSGAESAGRVPTIAEVKPTSPTTAGIRKTDPARVARAMVAGGAAAVSVLTEPDHFGGSPDALEQVRATVDVPVLRKDFVLHERQLDVVPADAVLLIARFVDDLDAMVGAARARGMQPLVEVHTPEELGTAVQAGANLIGINNRDLASLEVDLDTFGHVAPGAPADVTLIAESGVTDAGDVRHLRAAGADAVLVGSAIMAGDDIAESTRELVNA